MPKVTKGMGATYSDPNAEPVPGVPSAPKPKTVTVTVDELDELRKEVEFQREEAARKDAEAKALAVELAELKAAAKPAPKPHSTGSRSVPTKANVIFNPPKDN